MSAYLDGELGTGLRTRMERHVDECRECRSVTKGLRLVIEGLHRLPAPEAHALQITSAVRERLTHSH